MTDTASHSPVPAPAAAPTPAPAPAPAPAAPAAAAPAAPASTAPVDTFADKVNRFFAAMNPFGKDVQGNPTICSVSYSDFCRVILFYSILYVFLGLFFWAMMAIALAIHDPQPPPM